MPGRNKPSPSKEKPPGRSQASKKVRSPNTRTTPAGKRRWSAWVMQHSDALDLEPGVFQMRSAQKIAASLKHSAEERDRRKGTPYQSAMSMLNFYINRAGRKLTDGRKRVLERAKRELRKVFGRAA